MNRINIFYPLLLAIALLASTSVLSAELDTLQQEQSQGLNQEVSKKKKFDAGKFLFGHIGDSHEWHIATIDETHITVPLPIILYSRTKNKLFSFWSAKFNHGHSTYKGFKLVTEGDLEGKIVEVNDKGQTLDLPLPLDFSITKNVVGIFFSIIILLLVLLPVARKYKSNPHKAPTGTQSLMESLILFVRDDIAKPSIGEKHYLKVTPFLLTLFFFIFLNNLLGLIPIFPAGANVTGNIAVTMGLALITLFTIFFYANKNFWRGIVNPPEIPIFLKLPIPIMPVIEAVGWIIKPAVLMVRLFANILAGHMIVLVFFALIFIFGAVNTYYGYGISVVSVLLTVFMTFVELLVAFIQAYIFTMLSAIFLGMATEEHN
ncbi:MAG: F0F1 ATP synthase subunit A [Bacteroidales bacterium]|nr:F0F1 ATP synthase subunit A [Bacteroidales bacterium]MDD4673479.1 F0F1 ATP synthase subunit A [Bacteroidales bacterium]